MGDFEVAGMSWVRSIISGISRKESLLLKTEDNVEEAVDERLEFRWKGCLMLGDLARRGFEGFEGFEGMAGLANVFV